MDTLLKTGFNNAVMAPLQSSTVKEIIYPQMEQREDIIQDKLRIIDMGRDSREIVLMNFQRSEMRQRSNSVFGHGGILGQQIFSSQIKDKKKQIN